MIGPGASQWLKQMLPSLTSHHLKSRQQEFEKIWEPFIDFIQDFAVSDEQCLSACTAAVN